MMSTFLRNIMVSLSWIVCILHFFSGLKVTLNRWECPSHVSCCWGSHNDKIFAWARYIFPWKSIWKLFLSWRSGKFDTELILYLFLKPACLNKSLLIQDQHLYKTLEIVIWLCLWSLVFLGGNFPNPGVADLIRSNPCNKKNDPTQDKHFWWGPNTSTQSGDYVHSPTVLCGEKSDWPFEHKT